MFADQSEVVSDAEARTAIMAEYGKPVEVGGAYTPLPGRRVPVIALVGSDGSGKTTLGATLFDWMNTRQPTRFCHLGKQTGSWGRAIARMPLIGRRADKAIAGKAVQSRQGQGVGPGAALIIFLLSMRRLLRFVRMRGLHKRGYVILTDRYPQAVVPGPMDGPGLVARQPKHGLVRLLTRLEQAVYVWMAGFRPDLVLRLNIDLATALARKPDHRPETLRQKVADVPRLSFNGAPVVELDATQPLQEVLETARYHVSAVLEAYQPGGGRSSAGGCH
ncbi:nucleoside triphosphate hydrolase [Acetobacter suratthaniensis]|uniref:nucleoside triphosphate hydrolase n=1 Tax=Acetobacter suratthaniensis TaxID=1502841 RepID=UPI001FAF1A7B|nr:nucleoside triphosphate hydrolase [Acetobacter suratthaniensis]MCX2565748.1 nucleoside triphosphate hydrolase [Acetobacter suratthaniensis]